MDRRIVIMGIRLTPERHLDLAHRIAKAFGDELEKSLGDEERVIHGPKVPDGGDSGYTGGGEGK